MRPSSAASKLASVVVAPTAKRWWLWPSSLSNPKGFGRCRLRTIPDAEAPTLRSFLLDCVEPGSVIVTDGFASYPPRHRR